jgi:hypothetical protein
MSELFAECDGLEVDFDTGNQPVNAVKMQMMQANWEQEFKLRFRSKMSLESYPSLQSAINTMQESDVIVIAQDEYQQLVSSSSDQLRILYSKLNEYGVILTYRNHLPRPFQVLKQVSSLDLFIHSKQAAPAAVTEPSLEENEEELQVVCISDTHNLHRHIASIPSGDVLIHAGDFSNAGELDQIMDFIDWMHALPHRVKILIAGNHDLTVHESFYEAEGRQRFHGSNRRGSKLANYDPKAVRTYLTRYEDIIYLEDAGVVVDIPSKRSTGQSYQLKIYGSPWQPEFHRWAFNAQRGEEILLIWKQIPSNIDILVTHGPPYGYGDRCIDGFRAGCQDLSTEIDRRIHPRLHVFGHIHEDVGVWMPRDDDGDSAPKHRTTYVNACTCDLRYQANHKPIIIRYPIDPSKRSYR